MAKGRVIDRNLMRVSFAARKAILIFTRKVLEESADKDRLTRQIGVHVTT